MPRQLLYTICLCVLICDPADADSYAEFEDVLEIDRTHCFFVIATRCEIPNVRQVEIRVWTRLHPDAQALLLGEDGRNQRLLDGVSSGPIRIIYEGRLDYLPAVIRVGPKAVAALDYDGINYGGLKQGSALQITRFEDERTIAFLLQDLGIEIEQCHDGRGIVSWLRDAWFDETGDFLYLVVAGRGQARRMLSVLRVSVVSGQVEIVSRSDIARLAASVDSRFMRPVLLAAIDQEIEGLNAILEGVLADDSKPIQARLVAAERLWTQGNETAGKLIREIAAFESFDINAIHHASLSEVRLYEQDYWWNTIGYSAEALRNRQESRHVESKNRPARGVENRDPKNPR